MAKQAYIYDGTAWVPVGSQAATATSANIINTVIQRDGSGNFSAGTITATTITATTVTATNINGGIVTGITSTAAGRGVAVLQPAGDATPAILQFTNNAVTVQQGSITADASGNMVIAPTSGVLSIGSYKAVRDLTNNNGQIQHGVVSSTATIGAGGSMFIPYTFPVAFAGTPNVTVSYNSGAGGSVYIVPRVLAISSSGANFYFYNTTTAAGVSISHQVQWIGIY